MIKRNIIVGLKRLSWLLPLLFAARPIIKWGWDDVSDWILSALVWWFSVFLLVRISIWVLEKGIISALKKTSWWLLFLVIARIFIDEGWHYYGWWQYVLIGIASGGAAFLLVRVLIWVLKGFFGVDEGEGGTGVSQ